MLLLFERDKTYKLSNRVKQNNVLFVITISYVTLV